MAKYSENPILSSDVNWNEPDPQNGLKWSGKSIREFQQRKNKETENNTATKFGAEYYIPGTLVKYNFASEEDKAAWLESGDSSLILSVSEPNFTGKQRQLKITSSQPQNLYFIATSEKAEITVGFVSQEKDVTASYWTEVYEDAFFTVLVDKGSAGEWQTILENKRIKNGETLTVDVRKYLINGANRVRFIAKGETSEENASFIFNANVTTMYLSPSNFNWAKPYIEGNAYSLGGVNIGGALNKTLHIRITGEDYNQLYEDVLGTQTFINNAYYFNNLAFPTTGTGVYHVEMWLSATGIESEHLHYDVMCIASTDIDTAQLAIINDVSQEILNYSDGEVFKYACYNKGAAEASPSIKIAINGQGLISETLSGVTTSKAQSYTASIEIDSDASEIVASAEVVFGNTARANLIVDNSASFPATPNPIFYLQPSTRSNSQSNREKFVNAVTGEEVSVESERMAYVDGIDGWTVDANGRKCLRVPAGSKLISDYAPLASIGNGRSIEFVYQVNNASNEDDSVITICDDPLSTTFRGLRIRPEQITLHSRDLNVSDLSQSYYVDTGKLIDLVVSIIPRYKTSYGNLAIIFVNGTKVCEFGYENTDSFVTNAKLALGSATADLDVYAVRVYDRAFDSEASLRNQEASLRTRQEKEQARAENTADLGVDGRISYQAVKDRINTFTVKMRNGAKLPGYGLLKEYSAYCDLTINLVQKAWKVILNYLRIEGQGTTSMNYWLWNLRFRIDKSGNVIIIYPDGTEATVGNIWFDGVGVHPAVQRMTFKKNYASSMQSHKMGSCRMYNDIYFYLADLHPDWELLNEAKALMAVYQYPAIGFELVEGENSDELIDNFIGLYTIGPDKGDPATFGYDRFKSSLLRLEGLDHNFKAVGYDYPWSELKYVANEESICYLKDGVWQKAWEVGAAGTAKTEEEIQAYLDAEYSPAYKLVYDCSTMILGTTSSLSQMNVNPEAWGLQKDPDGHSYQRYEFWVDEEYDVIYYNEQEKKYVKNGTNLLTQLGISADSLTGLTLDEKNEMFKSARRAMFKQSADKYFNVRGNISCMQHGLILAISDNLKKNTYWEKFVEFANGGRIRQKRDDDDSCFRSDNQSYPSKSYSVEQYDWTDDTKSAYVFKGEDSRFFRLLTECYPDECAEVGLEILRAMSEKASKGSGSMERLMQYLDDQFFSLAQDYFSRAAYNADTELAYEDAYPHYKSGQYDVDVNPLAQAHGSSIESERAWAWKRMIYMASKFRFGPFAQYQDTSLGRITFRTQTAHSVTLTPAMDLYPCILSGQGGGSYAGRTKKGQAVTLSGVGGSNTNVYIMAADYLEDIGDLCKLAVDAATDASLSVASKSLKRLKVGDATPEEVTSNLQSLNIANAPALITLDARNLASLTGNIDLTTCTRILSALFGGTDVRSVSLLDGSKIETLQLSDVVTSLALRNLKFLTADNFEYNTLAKVEYLRVENNAYLNGFAMLKEAYYAENSALKNIRVIGFDYTGDATDFDMLAALASGDYTGIDADGNATEDLPIIEGTLRAISPVYQDAVDVIKKQYPALNIIVENGYYVRFKDPEVQRICKENWGDGMGITEAQVENITEIGEKFKNNTLIETFDEFERFIGITSVGSYGWSSGGFNGCTNLRSIKLPITAKNLCPGCFANTTSLTNLENTENIESIGHGSFGGSVFSKSGISVLNLPSLKECLGNANFASCPNLEKVLSLGRITALDCPNDYTAGQFGNCPKLKQVILPETLTTLGWNTFINCSELTHCNFPTALQTIKGLAFANCPKLECESLVLPNLTYIGTSVFSGCKAFSANVEFNAITKLEHHVFANTSIRSFRGANLLEISTNNSSGENGAFVNCTNLLSIDIPKVQVIYSWAFAYCSQLSIDLDFSGLTLVKDGAFCKSAIRRILNLGTVTALTGSNTWNSFGAFWQCPNLEVVILPETTTSIAAYPFRECELLGTIVNKAVSPASLGSEAFAGSLIASGTGSIYVPDDSVVAYREASNWSTYAARIFPLSQLQTDNPELYEEIKEYL